MREQLAAGHSLLVAGRVFPSRTKARNAIESNSVSIRSHLSDTWQKVEFNDVISINFSKIVIKFGKKDFKILNLENLIWTELEKL
jgi:ribosomal 50S subunit-recycling heat shock protein